MTDEESATSESRPAVAVFRPDDDRLSEAVDRLEDLGARPIADPMLEIERTGAVPASDADVYVFTSPTAATCLPADWSPGQATVWAIGPATAEAVEEVGIRVKQIPETYSSRGLVEAMSEVVEGRSVEVARSDHGSDVLIAGLEAAGARVTETVLYRLARPESAGRSAELAAAGDLDGALFTSSLTVEHFLAAAASRDRRQAAIDGLAGAVVGAIGEPTRETAETAGISVDVVPAEATFESLARATIERIRQSR